jgi:hypothetical protein
MTMMAVGAKRADCRRAQRNICRYITRLFNTFLGPPFLDPCIGLSDVSPASSACTPVSSRYPRWSLSCFLAHNRVVAKGCFERVLMGQCRRRQHRHRPLLGDPRLAVFQTFAADTQAMLIPPPTFQAPKGVRAYPRDSVLSDVTTDRDGPPRCPGDVGFRRARHLHIVGD